jgi:hypothetical protein
MMPGLSPAHQELRQGTGVKPATDDQSLSPRLSNHTDDPPLEKRTAAPVASRGSGAKKHARKVDARTYTSISLLDKWRLLHAIFACRSLSPTAKVVAGVLLNCLNCKSGKCCPSIAHLEPRTGRKRRMISAGIAELVERGWISYRRRRGSSAYRFAFDRVLHDGVPEIAQHESEDKREAACLDRQQSADLPVRESAHLNTGNLETENRNQEVVEPGDIPLPDNSSIRQPAKRQRKQPTTRKARLGHDWQPSEQDIEAALKSGLSEHAIPREALKFKNYHLGKGTLMLDWHRAWQNWTINAVEWGRSKRPNLHSSRALVDALLDKTGPDQWGQS